MPRRGADVDSARELSSYVCLVSIQLLSLTINGDVIHAMIELESKGSREYPVLYGKRREEEVFGDISL